MEQGESIKSQQISAEILIWEERIQFAFHGSAKLSRKWAEMLESFGIEVEEIFCSPCG